MPIVWKDVRSEMIARVGYDAAASELAVVFKAQDGGPAPCEYHYAGVPRAVHDELVGAALKAAAGAPGASVGRAFHRLVRGRYPTTRVAHDGTVVVRRATAVCTHGAEIMDPSGRRLEPPCGCRLTTTLREHAGMLAAAMMGVEAALGMCERGVPGLDEIREEVLRRLTGAPAAATKTETAPTEGAADPFALSREVLT